MMPKSSRERFFWHAKCGVISEGSRFSRSRVDSPPLPSIFLKSGPSREDQEGKVSHAGTILLKQRSADDGKRFPAMDVASPIL